MSRQRDDLEERLNKLESDIADLRYENERLRDTVAELGRERLYDKFNPTK